MILNNRIYFSLLFSVVLLLSGCGLKKIQYSRNGASIPPDAKTFSVNFFENRAVYVDPMLSNEFTEMLKEKFRSQTNLSEVLDGDGDLHFEGEITADYLRPIDITRDEYAGSTRMTIEVRVKYTNKVDDKFDYDSRFSAYRDLGETQDRSEVSQELIKEILEQIIDDIYNKAVVNW